LGMAIGLPAPMEGVINEVIIIYIYIYIYIYIEIVFKCKFQH